MKDFTLVELSEIELYMSAINDELDRVQSGGFYDESYIEEKLNLLEDILLGRDD